MSNHRDKIVMDGLHFYGRHGLFEEETKLGQKFIVDLELYVDIATPAKSGQMEDGVHYGEVYGTVREIVEGEPVHLIESLSENIAQKLLAGYPLIDGLMVRVSKPHAPIPGIFDNVAVEIYRERQSFTGGR